MPNALKTGQSILQYLSVAKLPAMPHILIRLIELCHDEDMVLNDLAKLIAQDAAVTMKILDAAHSSVYPHHNRRLSLDQSLLTLGMDTIKTLLISESISHVFNGFNKTESFDLRGFWRHSLTVALASQKLAVMTHYPHPEEAYLAGLIHDVGRLALLSIAPKEYSMLFSHVDDIGLCEAEKLTFKISHPEVGSWLLGQYHFDSFLADSVLYHHEPVEQTAVAHPLIRILIFADLLACHGLAAPAFDAARIFFNLGEDDVKAISLSTETRIHEVAEFLKIDLSGTEQAMTVPYPSQSANDVIEVRDRLTHEVHQVILASEVRRSLTHEFDEPGMLQAVAESSAMLFGFRDVLLLMRDERNGCLRGVPLRSTRPHLAELTLALDDGGNISNSLQQRQVAFLDAESNVLNLPEKQIFRQFDAEHLVCLPIYRGQQRLGVLLAPTTLHQFTELRAREHFLRAFAGEAAAAIERARASTTETANMAQAYRQETRRIVHEANNPLSIIKNYITVLDTKLERKESVKTEISFLQQEIDRVGQILHEFSEDVSGTAKSFAGINLIVSDVVRLFRSTEFLPASIHVDMKLQEELATIQVDRNALKQVLVNLIKNAVEAMQGAGEISISTYGPINRNGRLFCGLTMRDNGPGIPQPLLEKLFSPVQSVKPGKHAGLGLSIVHGLIQGMDGSITCRSRAGETQFEILLPLDRGNTEK